MLYVCMTVVFFQAEDGIRDLVRSRGLGDVYKRQGDVLAFLPNSALINDAVETIEKGIDLECADVYAPVSYTHLTLPTSDLV